jgi:hypothetical protein
MDDDEKQKKNKINNLSFLSFDDRNWELWSDVSLLWGKYKKMMKKRSNECNTMGWVRVILK